MPPSRRSSRSWSPKTPHERAGNSIPPNDVRIASLARQYALPLLSNDTHFDRVDGVERIAF